jgi:hypothetical protein
MDKPSWDSSHADEARNELLAERQERFHEPTAAEVLADERDRLIAELRVDLE